MVIAIYWYLADEEMLSSNLLLQIMIFFRVVLINRGAYHTYDIPLMVKHLSGYIGVNSFSEADNHRKSLFDKGLGNALRSF